MKGVPKLVCALMRTGPVGSLGGDSLRDTVRVMGVHGRGPACECAHWGRRWISLWSTLRVSGVPTLAWARIRTSPPGPQVELPMARGAC